VVIVDVGLPEIDGYELARRLRDMPGMVRAVLVALTGYGRSENEQRAFAAGFRHHLLKPVDLDRLQAILAAAIPGADLPGPTSRRSSDGSRSSLASSWIDREWQTPMVRSASR
jgi:DNA-binding response OmpR family regulator